MTSSTFPLVVVTNRLPVSFSIDEVGAKTPTLSPGGLVAGVAPSLRGKKSAWIGWDGTYSGATDQIIAEGITLFPVALSASLVKSHYEGFSNGTLWPLFHDVGVEPEFDSSWWEAYRGVNATCASRAAEVTDLGGIVWVHDYQMMLVPALLRKLRPDVTIGYFHHIPFCRPEKLAVLPEYKQLLQGIAGSDIAGFQRDQDRDNFRAALSTAQLGDLRADTYPISLDFEGVSTEASNSAVRARAVELRQEWGNPKKVFLGVDRIDYSKGIPERLEAFEGLLQTGQLSVDDCVMVQVGSPSRQNVPSYQALQARIEEVVTRINLAFRGPEGRAAIVYSAQNLERSEMLAHFVAADVMVVSSLRDGMNLVAKEFVACRNNDSGVLILSPFAGAADRMVDALIADPTRRSDLQAAMMLAIGMTPAEQKKRIAALRREVRVYDVAWWADQILGDLASLRPNP